MDVTIEGLRFYPKDDCSDPQEAFNRFCEGIFASQNVPINKLHRHVEAIHMPYDTVRSVDFPETIMKGMAASEQRYIAIAVEKRYTYCNNILEKSWSKHNILLLFEGRDPMGGNKEWESRFSHREVFKDVETEFTIPSRVAQLLSEGIYTCVDSGGELYQVRLRGSDQEY